MAAAGGELRSKVSGILAGVESLLKAGSYLMPVAPQGATEQETLVFESRIQLMYTLADIAGLLRSHFDHPSPPDLKRRLQTAFKLLRASQLSLEMDCGGLRAAVVVETIKLAIRLLLLALQQNRTLLVDVAEGEDHAEDAGGFVGARTGLRLPPMRTMPYAAVAVPRITGFNPALPCPEDCLMMLRPLVYLGACAWSPLQQWEPWLIASSMDLLGVLILRERLRRDMVKPGDPREREYRRRVRVMVMGILLRSPMFDVLLRRPLESLSRAWERIPVLNCLNYVGYYLFLHRFYYGLGAGDS
ncbi:hypothetical protein FOL46_000201 [Perkinsus olseni]|uniref:Peroxisomal membrane protein PEX16 n=1 Tax=Perkinsus olseni TaxID=32597 RepID=A0A7J6MJ56_PEROL|nr:hypothetical protein FOL46_000201 [Perkinsus olseni]